MTMWTAVLLLATAGITTSTEGPEMFSASSAYSATAHTTPATESTSRSTPSQPSTPSFASPPPPSSTSPPPPPSPPPPQPEYATEGPGVLQQPPNIIFILADDLGFNDVAFRGSDQVPTPNIDALAYGGLILDKYYVTPVCTPTRAALLTGRHPIHNGMQHRVLFGAEPRGLPLTETLLPQHLRRLGYATHLVGKWHLGHFRKEYTPTFRGFDSHLGFWTGHHDYFDHTAVEGNYWGLDMRRGLEPAWELHGQYTTEVLTSAAERVVAAHNSSRPLFLMLAHAAVHSANPYSPLPAPDDSVARFAHIEDYKRRRFAAVLSELDKSVGRVVRALQNHNMLANSIIVFSTDNGGPAAGFNSNAASNWPLRGVKNTLWEGGVRGAGVLWAPQVERPGRLASQLLHITDWLPTLYRAAGGDPTSLSVPLDGVDAWEALTRDVPTARQAVLHNIDDEYGTAAVTHGDWKLIQGSTYGDDWNGWYGPSGRKPGERYDLGQVLGSKTARALRALGRPLSPGAARALRAQATLRCPQRGSSTGMPAHPLAGDGHGTKADDEDVAGTVEDMEASASCRPHKAPCLFNVKDDPCERNNLAARFPALLRHLQQVLAAANATAVPPSNLPWDPRADPRFWDHTWTNFGDYSVFANAVSTSSKSSLPELFVWLFLQIALSLISELQLLLL